MIKLLSPQPVHSEYRYFQSQEQNKMFNQYSLYQNISAKAHQHNKLIHIQPSEATLKH